MFIIGQFMNKSSILLKHYCINTENCSEDKTHVLPMVTGILQLVHLLQRHLLLHKMLQSHLLLGTICYYVLIILPHIYNMEAKSSSQRGAFFTPDVCQMSSR